MKFIEDRLTMEYIHVYDVICVLQSLTLNHVML